MVTTAEQALKEQRTQSKQLSEIEKAQIKTLLKRLAFGIAVNIINCENNKNE